MEKCARYVGDSCVKYNKILLRVFSLIEDYIVIGNFNSYEVKLKN